MWKILLFIFILKSVQSLNVEDIEIFNDNTVNKLNNLRKEWLKLMLTIPDGGWVIHNSPNPKFLSSSSSNDQHIPIDLNRLKYNASTDSINKAKNDSITGNFHYSDAVQLKSTSTGNKCTYDLIYLLFNLQKKWALQMLDAAGKLPSGVLQGNLYWLGDFKECRNITVPLEVIGNMHFGDFKGEYCYIKWTITLNEMNANLPIYMGICLPDSCNEEYLLNNVERLEKLLSYIPVVNKLKKYINNTQVTCQTSTIEWESSHITYMCILSIFAILIVLGTICDVIKTYKKNKKDDRLEIEDQNSNIYDGNSTENYKRYEVNDDNVGIISTETSDSGECFVSESAIVQFLVCFSAYTNAAKIFNIENTSNHLRCIHGFRFMSMAWIIVGYNFIILATFSENLIELLDIARQFYALLIIQATYAVDTFFLISGLLLSYLFMKRYNVRNKKFSWIRFYLHRIWRLTPASLMILGFYTTVWLHTGSGPFWPKENNNCKYYWWWNLLYIQNFKGFSDMCMNWSWYLASDMQFFIISPLFLLLLWIFPAIGIIFASIIMVISMIVTGLLGKANLMSVISSIETLESKLGELQNDLTNYYDYTYDKPYCRIGPYLVGILTGYAIYKVNDCKVYFNKKIVALCWTIAFAITSSVVFGIYHAHMGTVVTSIYNALSRTGWSIAIAWMIFACVAGFGGIMDSILSCKVWIPLSRLSYSAYLIFPIIINGFYSSLYKALHCKLNALILYGFGMVIVSYLSAFVVCLAFESSTMAVEKFILRRFSKK